MIRIAFTIGYLISMLFQGLLTEKEFGWWLFQFGILLGIHLVCWDDIEIDKSEKCNIQYKS